MIWDVPTYTSQSPTVIRRILSNIMPPKQFDANPLNIYNVIEVRIATENYLLGGCTKKVKTVVVALRIRNLANTGSLEEVGPDCCS